MDVQCVQIGIQVIRQNAPAAGSVKRARQCPDPDGTAQAGMNGIPEKQGENDDLIGERGAGVGSLQRSIGRREIAPLLLALCDF